MEKAANIFSPKWEVITDASEDKKYLYFATKYVKVFLFFTVKVFESKH